MQVPGEHHKHKVLLTWALSTELEGSFATEGTFPAEPAQENPVCLPNDVLRPFAGLSEAPR